MRYFDWYGSSLWAASEICALTLVLALAVGKDKLGPDALSLVQLLGTIQREISFHILSSSCLGSV